MTRVPGSSAVPPSSRVAAPVLPLDLTTRPTPGHRIERLVTTPDLPTRASVLVRTSMPRAVQEAAHQHRVAARTGCRPWLPRTPAPGRAARSGSRPGQPRGQAPDRDAGQPEPGGEHLRHQQQRRQHDPDLPVRHAVLRFARAGWKVPPRRARARPLQPPVAFGYPLHVPAKPPPGGGVGPPVTLHTRQESSMRTVIVLGAALAAIAPAARSQAAQRYTVAGDNVAIYNLAGVVRVEGGPAGDVVVEVTRLRRRRRQAPGRNRTDRIPPDAARDLSRRRHHLSRHGRAFELEPRRARRRDVQRRQHVRSAAATASGSAGTAPAWTPMRTSASWCPLAAASRCTWRSDKMTATNVNGDVKLDVSSADVTASGMRGSLSVDAGSGDVRVTDATGDLNLDTGSGNVVVSGAHGDDLLIDTGSGDVTLDHAEGRSLKIDTGSGNADATAVKADDLVIDTGSGDVTLELLVRAAARSTSIPAPARSTSRCPPITARTWCSTPGRAISTWAASRSRSARSPKTTWKGASGTARGGCTWRRGAGM